MTVAERRLAQIKQAMGMRRFLCWSMASVAGEMAIGVLSYKLRRMIGRIGARQLIEALQ